MKSQVLIRSAKHETVKHEELLSPKSLHMSEQSQIPELGGGFEYLLFSPLFGEDFQFD